MTADTKETPGLPLGHPYKSGRVRFLSEDGRSCEGCNEWLGHDTEEGDRWCGDDESAHLPAPSEPPAVVEPDCACEGIARQMVDEGRLPHRIDCPKWKPGAWKAATPEAAPSASHKFTTIALVGEILGICGSSETPRIRLLTLLEAALDARAREERLRIAKLVCSWCRIGIPITADPEFGRLDAIYHLEGEGPASAAILCRAMELHILEPGDAD